MQALHYGAKIGHLDVCKLLLKAGAPVDAKDKVWESISNFHQITVFFHRTVKKLLLWILLSLIKCENICYHSEMIIKQYK